MCYFVRVHLKRIDLVIHVSLMHQNTKYINDMNVNSINFSELISLIKNINRKYNYFKKLIPYKLINIKFQ